MTLARATRRTWGALLVEPRLRLGFRDNREDLDLCFGDVIEHPYLAYPKAVLRLVESPKPLDAALAQLRRLEPKVQFDTIPNLRSRMGRKQVTDPPAKPGALRREPPKAA